MTETTSTEFVEWQRFFRQELENPTREELYLAQIAAECRRFVAKDPKQVNLSQFILSLLPRNGGQLDKKTMATRIITSKAYWFGLTKARNQHKA